jgi:thioredoxin 1
MTDELEEIRQQKMAELRTEERGKDSDSSADESPSEPVEVDGVEAFQDVVNGAGVVLVDFYADWCGPCKQLEPIVESVAAGTDATVANVDIDTNQGLATQYGVRSVPTLLLFADGEAVEQLVGLQQEPKLRSLVERYS